MSESDETRSRLAPVSATTRELYLYSGNRCAFHTENENCYQPLLREDGTWNCQVAHIYGVKPSAARGDHSLDPEELRHPRNLVLMCLEHHKVIDNKDLEAEYTVACVQAMKDAHESRYRAAMSGLDRIVDTGGRPAPRLPVNFQAMTGIDDDESVAAFLADITTFAEDLARQPLPIRDLIAMILIHGHLEKRFGSGFHPGVGVSVVMIEGIASIAPSDVARRAGHLEQAGLLSFFDDDGVDYFALTSPLERSTGWDIFADLKAVAGDNAALVNRAVLDLDFSVFDA